MRSKKSNLQFRQREKNGEIPKSYQRDENVVEYEDDDWYNRSWSSCYSSQECVKKLSELKRRGILGTFQTTALSKISPDTEKSPRGQKRLAVTH